MSVYCDKFVGYSVDITEEYEQLEEETREFWEEDWNDEKSEQYSKFNYAAYYNKSTSLKGKVTILYDGLGGEYAKLIYVTEYEERTHEDDDSSVQREINKLLEDCPIPFEIKTNIKGVYREIFGKELEQTSKIKPCYLVHWH